MNFKKLFEQIRVNSVEAARFITGGSTATPDTMMVRTGGSTANYSAGRLRIGLRLSRFYR